MRKDIELEVSLSECEHLVSCAGWERLGPLLFSQGVQILRFPKPGAKGVPLSAAEAAALLAERWEEVGLEASAPGQRQFPTGGALLASGTEQIRWTFEFYFLSGRVRLSLGGLLGFQDLHEEQYVEPFTHLLATLARALYPELKPTLVAVGEASSGRELDEVLKRRLGCINWINIFGPPYVEKYSRDFLLGLPGYKVEELPDGGILHQLSPHFTTEDKAAAKELQSQVIAYCARAGLKVSCKAPYYMPRIAERQPSNPAEDREFAKYLSQMLGVTLLLKDNRRVKPVFVEWDSLSESQRQMALDAIRATVIDEIRQHRDARILFEFNELPEDLDELMESLVGRDNPDFEYVQVDMTPQTGGGQASGR